MRDMIEEFLGEELMGRLADTFSVFFCIPSIQNSTAMTKSTFDRSFRVG